MNTCPIATKRYLCYLKVYKSPEVVFKIFYSAVLLVRETLTLTSETTPPKQLYTADMVILTDNKFSVGPALDNVTYLLVK